MTKNKWGQSEHVSVLRVVVLIYIPYCPTDDAPPMIRMGCPAYLPRPSGTQGATRPAPPGPFAAGFTYSPQAAVVNGRGIAAAFSNDTFGGTFPAIYTGVKTFLQLVQLCYVEPCNFRIFIALLLYRVVSGTIFLDCVRTAFAAFATSS